MPTAHLDVSARSVDGFLDTLDLPLLRSWLAWFGVAIMDPKRLKAGWETRGPVGRRCIPGIKALASMTGSQPLAVWWIVTLHVCYVEGTQ